MTCPVTDADDSLAMIQAAVQRPGALHVLVNNLDFGGLSDGGRYHGHRRHGFGQRTQRPAEKWKVNLRN